MSRSRRWTSSIDEGVTSFKLFMAYKGVFLSDDGQILRAIQKRREQRRADDDARRERRGDRRARAAGARRAATPRRTSTASPGRGRPRRRPPTARSCSPTSPARRSTSCTSAPSRPSSRSPRRATRGQNVFGETCPQYLYLSLEEQLGAHPSSGATSRAPSGCARRRCARGPRATRTRCGSACAPTTSRWSRTDHCPFCMKDQKDMGIGDFSKIPNGIGSVEHRMDLHVPGRGRRARSRSSAGSRSDSTTPARMFGLYGQQGRHRAGRRRRRRDLRPERAHLDRRRQGPHHMNMDYSAWEGYEIDGHVDTVLSRGTVIVDETRLRRRQGRRPVRQARPVAEPDLSATWTSA